MAAAFDIHYAFHKAIPWLVEEDGWDRMFEEVDSSGYNCSMGFKKLENGSLMGRFQYTIESPVAHIFDLFPRPESLAANAAGNFFDMTLRELIAPGDAALEIKYTDGASLSAMRFFEAFFSHRPELREKEAEAPPVWAEHVERLSIRRGYPGPDEASVVMGPQQPETGKFMQQQGSFGAWFGVYKALPGDVMRILMTHGSFLPGSLVPHWIAPHCQQLLNSERTLFANVLSSDEMVMARSIDAGLYSTLSLRGCSRGPPLLPASAEEFEATDEQNRIDLPGNALRFWVRASRDDSRLAPYLRSLLHRCGLDGIDVFDSLDGRELLHYQVVVKNDTWQTSTARITDILSQHRAAYRRLNGGKTAPQLVESAARYREDTFGDSASLDDEEEEEGAALVVRNTFLELADSPSAAAAQERIRRNMSS